MTQHLKAPTIGEPENKEDEPKSLQTIDEQNNRATSMMTVSELTNRRDIITQVYENVMIEDVHYGKPFKDSNKPTLLKSGGEVLATTFMLSPKYIRTLRELGKGHREIEFCCQLFHIPTGNFIGEGYGSCSTMESKYRYRSGDTATEIPIEPADWDIKDKSGNADFFDHLRKKYEQQVGSVPDGMDIGMTKVSGSWFVSTRGKVENSDIANEYNTVLKIAKKRALNDAVLTATGASQYFTQDVEDIIANQKASGDGGSGNDSGSTKKQPPRNGKKPPAQNKKPARNPNAMTADQRQLIIENMVNLPDKRQTKLMKLVESGKLSQVAAKRMIEFLISYDQLFGGIVELVDTAKHNRIPDVMWTCIESAAHVKDLQPIAECVSMIIDAEQDGDDVTEEVQTMMNLHLDNMIEAQQK